MTNGIKTRSHVAQENQWSLASLYPTQAEWQLEYEALKEDSASHFAPFTRFRGHLHEGAATLKEALEILLPLERRLEKLYTYAHLKHDEEVTQEKNKAAFEKIQALLLAFNEERSFFEPELLALKDQLLDQYIHSPLLEDYRFYLEKIIRMRPYTLSADKEALLAMSKRALGTPGKAFSAMNNADLKFGDILDGRGERRPLSHGLYGLYLRSSDRTLRVGAFEELHAQYQRFENTFAELISGKLESEIFRARARGFPSALSAALYPWGISETVYTILIATVRRFHPLLHRYVSLKKRLLGLDEIHLYDLYSLPHLIEDPLFTQAQAQELVITSTAPLGEPYQSALRKGLMQQRWVDWEESLGKRSGAYSSGCYDSSPYILLNFRGTLRDLFTLAHEAGHSMHSLLSRMHQPYQYYHYPIFIAEIASTLNEELLMTHLLKTREKKQERLLLIHERLEDIRATLLRQTLFAEFEMQIYALKEAGEPLTAATLKKTLMQLYRDYYGPELLLDEALAIEWARIPHFYYTFYVYQYATGIALSMAFAERVLQGDTTPYLDFLSAGGRGYPLELLHTAGFDLTTPAPIESALMRFEKLLTEFERVAFSN